MERPHQAYRQRRVGFAQQQPQLAAPAHQGRRAAVRTEHLIDAAIRIKRLQASSPRTTAKSSIATTPFDECADLPILHQRADWQWQDGPIGSPTSNVTARRKKLPG